VSTTVPLIVAIVGGVLACGGLTVGGIIVIVAMWRLLYGRRECTECGSLITVVERRAECPIHGPTRSLQVARRRKRDKDGRVTAPEQYG